MAQPSPQFASAKTETEVAVLQVQFENINEKVDNLKTDLKEMREAINHTSETAFRLIKEFKEDNAKAHKEVADKISALEKWRWMLMGAGILAGALGWPVLSKLLGI
jgi:signal recognition particle subunit SEC65